MKIQNPYESGLAPSAGEHQNSADPSLLANSVVRGTLIGAIAGMVLGVLTIGALFYFMPGFSGILEILILLIGAFFVLMLPCAGIGAFIGMAANSSRKRA